MSLRLNKCYLININNPDINIHLPHQVKVPVGTTHFPLGCPAANAHVFATADVEAMTVLVENISNGTAWNGEQHLDLHSKTVLVEGDELALDDGDEIYIVRFNPFEHHHREMKGIAEMFHSKTNNEIVVNFKKDTTKKTIVRDPKRKKRRWEEIVNIVFIYTPPELKPSSLIAGFGLIGTLVKIKYISKRACQWNLAFKNVCDKLHALQNNGYKIAIFSENLITKRLHLKLFKKKMYMLMRRIGIPIQVFMSERNEKMMKPALGMWSALTKRNQNNTIDTCRSFYVGCLGGRKTDASNEDRLFAVNVGIKFFTPEEYFLGTSVAPYRFPKFNPREPCTFNFDQLISTGQEVVIMVGPPDSGKTWICKHYMVPAGYIHISINFAIEMLRSKRIVKDFLQQGKSIVIDGMNPSADTRKIFVNIAKRRCLKCRCFEMDVSNEQLLHNRKFRRLCELKDGFKEEARIVAYDSFYQKPNLKEGFQQILSVPFAPMFNDAKLDSLYHMFLLPN